MRLSFCVQFLVMLCVMGCVFHVANSYERIQRKTKHLKANITQEHENIRVLQAEWAFLTNPMRLEKIASGTLQLESMDGRQLVALASMPLQTAFEESIAEEQPQIAARDEAMPTEDIARYVNDNGLPLPMPLLPALAPIMVSGEQGMQ